MIKFFPAFLLTTLVLFGARGALADDATSTSDTASSTPVVLDTSSASSTNATATSTSTTIDTGVSTSTATSTLLMAEGTTSVPASCEVLDSKGIAYDFPATSSPSSYLGICALAAAKDAGVIESYTLDNFPGIGLFVSSLGSVAADPSSQYWALYQNGSFASCGLGCLPITAGDSLMLQLHDFSDANLGDQVTIHVSSLLGTTTVASSTDATSSTPGNTTSAGTGGGGSPHQNLNIPAALSYLASRQREDGSFDSDLLTDWAAVAFSASNPGPAKDKLRAYLSSTTPSLSSPTDYERHAMALEALGINPSRGTSVDTIARITSNFDGTQIGDPGLDNDDIFALFPLLHAGYAAGDPMIQKEVAFILSKQKSDGSWDESVDVTAAAIQALKLVSSGGTPGAIAKAESYLHAQQHRDGGFGTGPGSNSFSTSWVLQAIAALNENIYSWDPAGFTPQDYLAGMQQMDGGVEPAASDSSTRVWATEYAIVGASMKPWDSLLSTFARNAENGTSPSAANANVPSATSTTATSTLSVATSSPLVASSTPAALPPMAALAATTSGAILGSATTSSAISTPPPANAAPPAHHGKRKAPHPSAALVAPTASVAVAQTAAAAQSQGSVFAQIWRFIAHLFAW